MTTRRQKFTGAATCAMLGSASIPRAALAAVAYPSKSIRLLVPFPPAGGADRVTRTLTRKLEQTMGATFVIENKGGANGTIALDTLAKAPADGYTLCLTLTDQPALNPALFDKPSYDTFRDFATVSLIASYPFVPAPAADSGLTSMKQAIDAVRASPESVSVGFPSANARPGLEQLQRRARARFNVTPYQGIALGMPDLIGGRLGIWIGTSATLRSHIEGGTVRGLAITAAKRLPSLPDVPSVTELGFPGFETVSWYGLLAPAATPRSIVSTLNARVNEALASPEVRSAFEQDGATLLGGNPERFHQGLRADTQSLGAPAKELSLNAD
ncbi:MAG: tripartite tricarboxylate transporter substrate binding protein [Burkholderiaceae bacterium]|nr:tripartite tricarboxylate transporter substrate binding protein [Burkholderiaceae bacterium]